MDNFVIELKNVSKTYHLYERNLVDRLKDTFFPGKVKRHTEFKALKDVNLKVETGEILGIVGRNGAGKSTLLKIIAGITQPTTGSVEIKGRIVPLLELGGGFNPEYTGKENIYFYCSLQGLKKEEIDVIYPEIVEFSELEEFIDVPIKKYSSGMKARLGFAVSVNIDPDILILDEVLAVGDELFRRKSFVKMEEFFQNGKTVLYVTHSLQSVIDICTKAILIHNGEIIIIDKPQLVVPRYRKLLTTVGSEKQRIVDSFKNNKIKPQNNKIAKLTADKEINEEEKYISTGPFFRENYLPASIKVIKEKNIDILNGGLFSEVGQKVNHILMGEDYYFSYTALFKETVENVSFGAIIYNSISKNVAGIYTPSQIERVKRITTGESYRLKFCFTAKLVPDVYLVRFVVRGQKGELIDHLSSIQDAILFRVLEEQQVEEHIGEITFFQSANYIKEQIN